VGWLELIVKLGAAVPVPLRVTLCGEPLALSATVSVAEYAEVEVGLNVTAIVQLAPAFSVVPQTVVSAKTLALVPPMTMLLILRAALPVFCRVMLCAALVVPESALKVSDEGLSETTGAEVTVPTPISVTACGEPVALSFTARVAVTLLVPDGMNVMEIMQLEPPFNVLPQLVVSAKPLPPVMAILLMLSVAFPVLVSVAICAALGVPTVEVKLSVPGVSDTAGTGAVVPVPLSVTECGEPPALSVTVRVPV
jgi:hypothetical protein